MDWSVSFEPVLPWALIALAGIAGLALLAALAIGRSRGTLLRALSFALLLAALANPTRRALFDRVRRRSQTVGELARQLPVSQPAVSQHLRRLREAGLVEERREGTRHYFQASHEGLAELRDYLDALWGDVLAAYAGGPPPAAAKKKRKEKR